MNDQTNKVKLSALWIIYIVLSLTVLVVSVLIASMLINLLQYTMTQSLEDVQWSAFRLLPIFGLGILLSLALWINYIISSKLKTAWSSYSRLLKVWQIFTLGLAGLLVLGVVACFGVALARLQLGIQ